MLVFNDDHKNVLLCYSKPIVHMRQQIAVGRFGLMFGAGLSKGFGIPTWKALVDELANDPEVLGQDVLAVVPPRAGLPYRTEMLFEHFKQRCYAKTSPDAHHTRALDYQIGANWREIIRKHLYAAVDGDLGKLVAEHPFFSQYLPLIQSTHMTVTYNFDDFIEQSLLSARSGEDVESRGFESVTNPWSQFRRKTAIIYHPNGVVPQNVLEAPSDRFVFSEASFADQLMGIFAGDQACLVSHLSKHTCLLVGLSLEDETLRSLLTQAARACPGNFHYYVHYLAPGERLSDENRQVIQLANFKVYNLVTLFLDDNGIRSLGDLVNVKTCPTDHFCDYAQEHRITVRFRFYFTGALGVGKSTTINYFRNLNVLDEWLEQRPAILAKDWKDLTPDEQANVDQWIADQFRKKNDVLRRKREGIFVLDRGPLDPLAFTPDDDWGRKASSLLATICPGSAGWNIEDGCVILLQGDCDELAIRMIATQRRTYTAEKLQDMEKRLGKTYEGAGLVRAETSGLTPSEVARRVAEIVHLGNYFPTNNLHQRLERIAKDGFNVGA